MNGGPAGAILRAMIPPSPTTAIDPTIARGVFAGMIPGTANRPACVEITFPSNNYRLHLVPTAPIESPKGKRVLGTIAVQARRIDETRTGGRFIEPVIGRPQRVQGVVIAVEEARNTIVLNAAAPIHVTPTDPRQKAGQFMVGQLVGFDALEGATFTPAG